jgi:hypothetical protein
MMGTSPVMQELASNDGKPLLIAGTGLVDRRAALG